MCSQTLEPMFPDSDHGIPDNGAWHFCVHDLVSPDAIRCSNAHQLVCDFWVSHRILYCFIGLQRHTPVDSRTRGIPHRSPEVSDGSSVSPMVNDDDHCDSLSLRLWVSRAQLRERSNNPYNPDYWSNQSLQFPNGERKFILQSHRFPRWESNKLWVLKKVLDLTDLCVKSPPSFPNITKINCKI